MKGELTFDEYDSQMESYEELQNSMLDAMKLYTTTLYSFDRLTCGGISALLSGTEYFCSPAGNDAAAGTRIAPWKNPAWAVNRVKNGDVVTLLPGTYTGKIEMKVSGITLRGTRGKSGEYLASLDAGETVRNWKPEPDLAEGMWSAPMKSPPGCVTVNGRMIILLGQRLMSLPPKKMRPAELVGKHYAYGKGNHQERVREMIPGLDLLALPPDIPIISGQFNNEKLKLWETAGGMMAGWRNGRLYLRLLGGRKPGSLLIRAGGSTAVSIRDLSGITIEDLKIGTARIGVSISGKEAKNNIIRRCCIEHGVNRIAVTGGASNNRILDNILSLGYIRPEFHSSTRWKHNRLVYIIFKYLVSSRQISDDDAMNFLYAGPGNLAEGNIVFQGLCGTDTRYCKDLILRNNVFREMSSCGIVLDRGSNQEVCGNVMIDNGINVRIHSFHQVPEGRTCFVHDNILYFSKGWGMQLFTLCAKDYPESQENVWFYHNTVIGSNYFMNERHFARVYKNVPQPISLANNLFVMEPKFRFTVPKLRFIGGNASVGGCADPKSQTEKNVFEAAIEGEKPFVKVKPSAEIMAKSIPLEKLPGMKGHSPLPGAVWNPKMIGLVRRSEQLSNEAANAMKTQ